MTVDHASVRLPLQSNNVIPSYRAKLDTEQHAALLPVDNSSSRLLATSRVDRAWMQPAPFSYGPTSRNAPNSLFATGVAGSDLNGSASAASWFLSPTSLTTMTSNRSSLVTLPDRGAPMDWGSLDLSWVLPDEPKHRPAAAAPGDRTPRPSPTRATQAPQTRPIAPDLRLAPTTLLTLPKGSPAPAAPTSKSNCNAANAALHALWPLPNMPPSADSDKENVAPKRRGRSPTPRKLDISAVPNLRPKRRKGVRTTAPSSFAFAVTYSPRSSPSPSPSPTRGRTTPRAGPRTGRPTTLARDADVSPLRLPDSVIHASATPTPVPAVPGAPVEAAAEASPAADNIDLFDLWADADIYDADEERGAGW